MGRRSTPLRCVCRQCGETFDVWNTGNQGTYCGRACKAEHERGGRDAPSRYQQGGYWMLRWNEGGKYRYQFEHRRVWEDANGPIPRGHEIHHANGDRLDNRLANLRVMRKADHLALHKRKYHTEAERLAADARRSREYRQRRKMA